LQERAYDVQLVSCQQFEALFSYQISTHYSTWYPAEIKGASMIKNRHLPTMESMTDVREQVDRIDSELVALLADRFACMDAAARIKQTRASVRDEERKAAVINHVKEMAAEAAIPVPTIAAIWEMLVESSISYEFQKWDQVREP